MLYFVAHAIGLLLVVILLFTRSVRTKFGRLVINETDPMKDTYRFEIDDLVDLKDKQKIIITVVYESRK